MKTKLILIAAVVAAFGAINGGAAAATGHAPVLDREQIVPMYGPATTSCSVDAAGSTITIDFSIYGIASLPYTGSSGFSGRAKLAVAGGGATLASLDSSFDLISTVPGSAVAVAGTTKGSGTCEGGVATLEISDAVYSAQLPDGSTDRGLVDLQLSNVPGTAPFSVVFDSTRSPEVDADGDRVWDGDDNCATIANADQKDTDHDFLGDVCDDYDNRPPLTLLGDLYYDTAQIGNGKKLLSPLDHAITAYKSGRTSATCSDLATYLSQVAGARGKTIPAATADALAAKATHIRVVIGC